MSAPFKEAAAVLAFLFAEFTKGFATSAGYTCGFLYGLQLMGLLP